MTGYTDSGDAQPDRPAPGPALPTAQERTDWGNQAQRILATPDYGDGDPTKWWADVTLRLLAALTTVERERDTARADADVWAARASTPDPIASQLDRLAPLAAQTGIPAATLLRMAVDDLLAPETMEAPTFDAVVDHVMLKNALLYRRLADPPEAGPT